MGWVFFVFTLVVLLGVTLWGLNQRKKYLELFTDYTNLENKMFAPLPGQIVQLGQRTAYVLGEGFNDYDEPIVFLVYTKDMSDANIQSITDEGIQDIQFTITREAYANSASPLDIRE